MIRVGTVNIDTSHPMAFAQVMQKDSRMRYVGVYNDSFRDDKEIEGFIQRFGLEKRCSTIDELAEMSDIGFIQGCDWDEHLRCAEPFLKRGKPVFVDKPLVGSLADCNKIRRLTKEGAVILGSSSARYAYEIQKFMAIPQEERGEIVSVMASCGVDEFNYGIHIVESIGGVMGTGAESVQYMGRGENAGQYTESYFIRFADGRSASFTILTGSWQPFDLTIITTKNTFVIQMDPDRLYAALLEQLCNYMEGKPNLMADTETLLESVEIMLAATASRAKSGVPVRLDELTEDDPSFDGPQFKKRYAAAANHMYAISK